MKHEEKCKKLHSCIDFASEYEVWREMARNTLMINLAPRIYNLSNCFYMGCGFHYSLEKDLGKQINNLAIGYNNINMNDFDRIDDIYASIMINQVNFEILCEGVIEAEYSARELKNKQE